MKKTARDITVVAVGVVIGIDLYRYLNKKANELLDKLHQATQHEPGN